MQDADEATIHPFPGLDDHEADETRYVTQVIVHMYDSKPISILSEEVLIDHHETDPFLVLSSPTNNREWLIPIDNLLFLDRMRLPLEQVAGHTEATYQKGGPDMSGPSEELASDLFSIPDDGLPEC
jgi:hypothetical protein